MQHSNHNFPLKLTLIRLILSPLLLPFLLVFLLPYNSDFFNILLALGFLLLSLTDFFDGYLARKYQQETVLGKLLDPLADKFLIFSTLIALVAVQKIYFYWAIIIIARDLFVMGLREIALKSGFSVPVSWAGKLKTTAQVLYLTWRIASIQIAPSCFLYIEHLLLTMMLVATIGSGLIYFLSFYRKYRHIAG